MLLYKFRLQMMMVDGEGCLLYQKSKKGLFYSACNLIAYPQEGVACDFLMHWKKDFKTKHIQRKITNSCIYYHNNCIQYLNIYVQICTNWFSACTYYCSESNHLSPWFSLSDLYLLEKDHLFESVYFFQINKSCFKPFMYDQIYFL